jgi:hypothetical protein
VLIRPTRITGATMTRISNSIALVFIEERFMDTKIFDYVLKELNTIKFTGIVQAEHCENFIIPDNRSYTGESNGR